MVTSTIYYEVYREGNECISVPEALDCSERGRGWEIAVF